MNTDLRESFVRDDTKEGESCGGGAFLGNLSEAGPCVVSLKLSLGVKTGDLEMEGWESGINCGDSSASVGEAGIKRLTFLVECFFGAVAVVTGSFRKSMSYISLAFGVLWEVTEGLYVSGSE